MNLTKEQLIKSEAILFTAFALYFWYGTGLNPAYKLTKKGARIMSALTLHKQEGKNYAEFVPDKSLLVEVQGE